MKDKLNATVDELAIIADMAVCVVIWGAAWELGKNLCRRILG